MDANLGTGPACGAASGGPVPPIEAGRLRCWAWVVKHSTAAAPPLPGCRGGSDRHQCPLLTAGSSVPAPLLSSAPARAAPACARDKRRRCRRATALPLPAPQSPPSPKLPLPNPSHAVVQRPLLPLSSSPCSLVNARPFLPAPGPSPILLPLSDRACARLSRHRRRRRRCACSCCRRR